MANTLSFRWASNSPPQCWRRQGLGPLWRPQATPPASYALTEEGPLYKSLNYTMRTPGKHMDQQLKQYAPSIKQSITAASCLPNFAVKVYCSMEMHILQKLWAKDKMVTWQSCLSESCSQLYAYVVVGTLPDRKLSGSLFVILPCVAKQIEMFSEVLAEQENLFLPYDLSR